MLVHVELDDGTKLLPEPINLENVMGLNLEFRPGVTFRQVGPASDWMADPSSGAGWIKHMVMLTDCQRVAIDGNSVTFVGDRDSYRSNNAPSGILIQGGNRTSMWS